MSALVRSLLQTVLRLRRRWQPRPLRLLARILLFVDRLRYKAYVRRHRLTVDDSGPDSLPSAVLAVVPHWRPESPDLIADRLSFLRRCISSLLSLDVDQVVVVIVTNDAAATEDAVAEEMLKPYSVPVRRISHAKRLNGPWTKRREVVVVDWRPGFIRRHGFYLTWAHAPILRRAARAGEFSHLIYLEDDLRFTDENLRYWCRYRQPLAAVGLLPGFVRFEWRGGVRYVTDQVERLPPRLGRRPVPAADDELCGHAVNLPNPYQALYVLDRELADKHFRFSRSRSPLRSNLSGWDIRERAATGPVFDDVPVGLKSRNVVPVHLEADSQRVHPGSLIEHMAGNYAHDSRSKFGKITVDDLFAAPKPKG